MNIHIPKWIFAAFVGAAPMLGIVCLILFSCTLLGLVQRLKISLTKSCAKRRRTSISDESFFVDEHENQATLFKSISNNIIISPFDDIPMKDIDAASSLRTYSETKEDVLIPIEFQHSQSIETVFAESDYDNGSSSIFNDNDYELDRESLIETSSQRKTAIKQPKSADAIINL